jgi:hypothetical protein
MVYVYYNLWVAQEEELSWLRSLLSAVIGGALESLV